MTSTQLNAAIARLDAAEAGYEAFGGRPVPFIGGAWRAVDFDAPAGRFGVIPAGWVDNPRPLVGFMPDLAWWYPEVWAAGRRWAAIRAALERAVRTMDPAAFGRADALVQGLTDRPPADGS